MIFFQLCYTLVHYVNCCFDAGHRSRRSMQEELSFDPHATRTVFVGNLEKTMMHGELRNIFERFGDVVVRL